MRERRCRREKKPRLIHGSYVHLIVRVNVSVPERDCSTTVGLFTHVPTYIPADEHQSGELLLSSVVYSDVERARVHVFGYVHVRKGQFYPLHSTKSLEEKQLAQGLSPDTPLQACLAGSKIPR